VYNLSGLTSGFTVRLATSSDIAQVEALVKTMVYARIIVSDVEQYTRLHRDNVSTRLNELNVIGQYLEHCMK